VISGRPLYWDPFDREIAADPYPIYRQMRMEAPLYYNDRHDFYALSRAEDVQGGLTDWQTYSSARGDILEVIKANLEIPPGTLLMEDPPIHHIHRRLLGRLFTANGIASIEPQIRDLCIRCLGRLAGVDCFDLMASFANEVPMRVIGMLLGIPESDQPTVRENVDALLRTEPGQQMRVGKTFANNEFFADYIDWRIDNPSDDLMTVLLNAEFEDETGTTRTLTREETLTYVNILAGAGNETTARLIGWLGALLARYPEQRTQLLEDRSLIPNAVEEALRFEPTGHAVARYVTTDVELHGQTVPAGSAMMLLVASANRDEQRWTDAEQFDVRRETGQLLTFGFGVHYCLGNALARLEARVALEEFLSVFPRWYVDWDHADLSSTSTMRGWETLPITVG
jgi:cytochrome P450